MTCVACVLAMMSFCSASDVPAFLSGKPVWPEGREKERNLFVGFRAAVEKPETGEVTLRCTGSTVYRAWVNGVFCGYGPARGPQGFYRVDEWNLTKDLKPGKNVVAIEVAGYNANSYYVLDQPSFLQAEIVAGGKVLAATGAADSPFQAAIIKERVEKVARYSFQRPSSEVYRLAPGWDRWRSDAEAAFEQVPCTVAPAKELRARRVPNPRFDLRPALSLVSTGLADPKVEVKKLWKDRSITDIGPKLGGYPESELESTPSFDMQRVKTLSRDAKNMPLDPASAVELPQNGFCILDLGQNLTGFPVLDVHCAQAMRLFVLFDETLVKDDVDWKRLGCINLVAYTLAPGDYALQAFEPYTMRYMKLLALDGACTVSKIGLRTYENPDTDRAFFASADPRLEKLFAAGRSTFAQNAVDVFMDCPHRERAGWLCDSFFTARSAKVLSGNALVERNFVENFLLPGRFEFLPDGMLPMCYPSDHNDGVFIPNWALWFVMELGEYLDRSGDQATVNALKPRVLALFDYFKPFKNEDGLLEKLKSWVFVEWSKANEFVQDVNYPSNMLYAGALSTASRLYGLPELEQEAQRIREVVRKQSFDGTFFVDNALRKEGRLEVTKNHSEVCQYFAFFFDVAGPDTHAELWRMLRDEFGPKRKETHAHENVYPANSFIGNMLRVELLSRYGRCQQILDESCDYLLYMADRTGTLWENVGDNASLNHGFASHIVNTLYRDVLGVYNIDPVKQVVQLRFGDVTLPWCKGRIPVGDGEVALEWRQNGNKLSYHLSLPKGFTKTVANPGNKELTEE